MGIGVSIFLLALGAILAFAVDFRVSGLDINTIGVILMVVGAIGLATSFLFWDRMGFGGGAAGGYRRRVTRDYVDDPALTAPRRTVRGREIIREDEVL
jgi:hypothetical protein